LFLGALEHHRPNRHLAQDDLGNGPSKETGHSRPSNLKALSLSSPGRTFLPITNASVDFGVETANLPAMACPARTAFRIDCIS